MKVQRGIDNTLKVKHIGNSISDLKFGIPPNKLFYVSVSDTSRFEQIIIEEDEHFNFLLKTEKKVVDLLKRLENEGKISEKEYKLIYPRDSRPGILYGSPKVHKPIINNCLLVKHI